jgi:hypothetical protein
MLIDTARYGRDQNKFVAVGKHVFTFLKEKTMKKLVVWLGVLTSLFSMMSIAAAQATDGLNGQQVPIPPSVTPSVPQEQMVREFGTSTTNILQLGSAYFHSRYEPGSLTYASAGRIYSTGGGDYWAPVNLPAGAHVSWLDLYACDTNATSHVNATLWSYTGSDTPTPAILTQVNSTQVAASGCSYWSAFFSHTINNDVRYHGGSHYAVVAYNNATDGTNMFKGVDLWWYRQVSPAPASASFSDVPTGHWAFQFIEALKASGITSGCAAGLYCPENNLTRAEMAVFLSKALGLHWETN